MQPWGEGAFTRDLDNIEIGFVKTVLTDCLRCAGIVSDGHGGAVNRRLVLIEERFECIHVTALYAAHKLRVVLRGRARRSEKRFQIDLLKIRQLSISGPADVSIVVGV